MNEMREQYVKFKSLSEDNRYKELEQLWIYQIGEVESSRDKAASRGTESAWRYHAGKEAGFKLAMTALQRAIADIEKKLDDEQDNSGDAILEELKIGDSK